MPIGGPIAGDRINGESAEIIGFLFQPGQMMSNVCKRRRLKECCKLQKYDCGMVQWYVFSSVAGTELLVATLEGLGFVTSDSYGLLW